jgi:hypothetical protein
VSRDSIDAKDSPAAISRTGTGAQMSAPFALTSGEYRVSAALSAAAATDVLLITLHKPDEPDPGDAEVLFIEFFKTTGEWSGNITIRVETQGEHFFEVSGTSSAWEIDIAHLAQLVPE